MMWTTIPTEVLPLLCHAVAKPEFIPASPRTALLPASRYGSHVVLKPFATHEDTSPSANNMSGGASAFMGICSL
jgi:hypothetical protein